MTSEQDTLATMIAHRTRLTMERGRLLARMDRMHSVQRTLVFNQLDALEARIEFLNHEIEYEVNR
jgi:hypothetical protein